VSKKVEESESEVEKPKAKKVTKKVEESESETDKPKKAKRVAKKTTTPVKEVFGSDSEDE
jgi:hypothetical protein